MDFLTLREFCARIRDQHGELHGAAIDEEDLEDGTMDSKVEDDVIDISSDKESQEDEEGPLVESDEDEDHKDLWI